ncbi:hypothetical protein NG800_018690, partial [Epilithonimonas ginsengisoli]
MCFLSFLFKKKKQAGSDEIRSNTESISAKHGVEEKEVQSEAHPADKYLALTADFYRAKQYDNAMDAANKAIALGKKPNEIMFSVINSKIIDRDNIDVMSVNEKNEFIREAIKNKHFLEFLYPSLSGFYDTIYKATPVAEFGGILCIAESDLKYEISKIKKLRSYKPDYIAEKP